MMNSLFLRLFCKSMIWGVYLSRQFPSSVHVTPDRYYNHIISLLFLYHCHLYSRKPNKVTYFNQLEVTVKSLFQYTLDYGSVQDFNQKYGNRNLVITFTFPFIIVYTLNNIPCHMFKIALNPTANGYIVKSFYPEMEKNTKKYTIDYIQ